MSFTPSLPSTACSGRACRTSPRRRRAPARSTADAIQDPPKEANMSRIEMKLEVVVIPVSDVDRAKSFYEGLGWRLDADFPGADDFRVVQMTPPGSPCSIHFGRKVTAAAPGSVQNLYLVVSDIEAARADLRSHGVNVSETFHFPGFGEKPAPGPDPEGRSY